MMVPGTSPLGTGETTTSTRAKRTSFHHDQSPNAHPTLNQPVLPSHHLGPKIFPLPLCQAARHPKSAQELANSLNRSRIHDHRSLTTVLHIISCKSLHWSQTEEVSMVVGQRGETRMGPVTPAPPSFSRTLPPSARRSFCGFALKEAQ
jgi:hypothetical protein